MVVKHHESVIHSIEGGGGCSPDAVTIATPEVVYLHTWITDMSEWEEVNCPDCKPTPAQAALLTLIDDATAALAALADEHEGEFRLRVNRVAIAASTLANEVAGW